MPADNTGIFIGYLAGRYPGLVGHLYCANKITPYPFLPYAIDNGAYTAHSRGEEWNPARFLDLLHFYRMSGVKPLWVAVPDAVADRDRTLENWTVWEPRLRPYGWPLAFVVQDGMVESDVPSGADVIFVGGSTRWKWRNLSVWKRFPRVHVGRVNTYRALRICEDMGVESCDGTGWVKGGRERQRILVRFLDEMTGKTPRKMIPCFSDILYRSG